MLSTYFRYHSGRTYPFFRLPTKIGCRRLKTSNLGAKRGHDSFGPRRLQASRLSAVTVDPPQHGAVVPTEKKTLAYCKNPRHVYLQTRTTRTLLTLRAVRIVVFYPEPGWSLRGRLFPRPWKLSTRRKRWVSRVRNQIDVFVDTPASAVRKTPRFRMRSTSTSRKPGENALTHRTRGRGRVKPKKTTGFYGVFVSFAKRIARRPRDVRPNVLLPFYGRQWHVAVLTL